MPDPIRPFRWDLAGEAQLGALLDDADPPDLWFLDELVACAARVLARSAEGDLYFVGRSMDSLYDLLTGVMRGTSWEERLRVLPLSLSQPWDEWLRPRERAQLRVNLAGEGLAPHDLARRRRPLVLVDLVATGSTFGAVFTVLRQWIADEGAQWDVIRLKLRFLGITQRTHTSPNTSRWWQGTEWPAELPPRAIKNVSMASDVWRYLADAQPKASVSFRVHRWLDESVQEPLRHREARTALAQAVALVEHGTRTETRDAFVRQLAREPSFREPWLRSLALEIRG